jgi:hypothetical protein
VLDDPRCPVPLPPPARARPNDCRTRRCTQALARSSKSSSRDVASAGLAVGGDKEFRVCKFCRHLLISTEQTRFRRHREFARSC